MVNDTVSHECEYPAGLTLDSMRQVSRAGKKLYLDPNDSCARSVLDSYRQFRLACMKTSLSLLRSIQLPNRVLISARLKRIESINRKITRNNSFSVNQMDDIIGFRIICESYLEAMDVGERLAGVNDAKKKDYVKELHPSGSGYRAIHVIVKFEQPFRDKLVMVRFEIQIRSWFQHRWACWCESQGEQIKEFNPNLGKNIGNEAKEVIGNLITISRKIANWEEKNQKRSQFCLPHLSNPYRVAVACVGLDGQNIFTPCGTNLSLALEYVRYNETRDLHPLLLLGVDAGDHDLERLLSMTHPKFVGNKFTYPEDWMPK